MPERFTETLRAASEPSWSHAVGHRFVKELFAGFMPDAVMARYLIQDHRFLDSFLILLGAALVTADTFEARLRLGRFIGAVSSEENTYFLRSFEALGVTEDRRAADPDTQATGGFKAIMREAAETRSYAAALSVLVVTEWLYLDGAPTRQSRCRTTSCTPSGSPYTTIPIFAPSSTFSARSWTVSALATWICAVTSFVERSLSNFPFSRPVTPIGPEIVLAERGQAYRGRHLAWRAFRRDP
jgi:thiaminase